MTEFDPPPLLSPRHSVKVVGGSIPTDKLCRPADSIACVVIEGDNMPELPEVETVKLQLRKNILNKKIKEVIVNDGRLIKQISAQSFKTRVEGRVIKDILRRGKVLVIKLDEKLFIIIHLRISGWLILGKYIEKFARVIFKLSDGELLNFCDQRVLGEVRLIDNWKELPIIKEMGPEPLDLEKEAFIKLFEGKKTKLKPLLMDQNFLAGVGNLYAQEALFCAGIHPERGADEINGKDLSRIYDCLIPILKQAIAKGGSSVDTYRQTDGKDGEYIPFLKVYQRQDEPCTRCRSPIKRKVVGGRGTCFCPKCQK